MKGSVKNLFNLKSLLNPQSQQQLLLTSELMLVNKLIAFSLLGIGIS